MNNLKTVGLLAFMTALWLVLVMQLFQVELWFMLVFIGGSTSSPTSSPPKMALASSRARPVTEAGAPPGLREVRRLATQMGSRSRRSTSSTLPSPTPLPPGRSPKHAAVAVTTGILQTLTPEELEAVLGHELAHVQNRDILIGSVAAMIGAAIAVVARMGFWFGGGDNRNNPIAAIGAIVSLILAPLTRCSSSSRSPEPVSSRPTSQGPRSPDSHSSWPVPWKDLRGNGPYSDAGQPSATSSSYIDNPLKAIRGPD